MNPAAPETQDRLKRSKRCFTIAVLLLVVMALLWSVDNSFVYISLGGAVFFFFLGFWNKPRTNAKENSGFRQKSYKSSYQKTYSSQSPSQRSVDLYSKVRNFFSSQTSSPARKARLISTVISLVTFGIFFIIVVSIIFGENTYYTEDNLQKAEQFRWDGQYDSAINYYRIVLSETPDHPQALMGYGNCFIAQGNYNSAVEAFARILENDPDQEEARYNKAIAHHYNKDYRVSLKESLRIIENNPDNGSAVVLAGDNYYMQQRYDSAIYWYENAYQSDNQSAWLCHVMAYIYDVKGNQKKAIDLYREALSYDSSRVEIYERLGELYPGLDGEKYRTTARKLRAEGY